MFPSGTGYKSTDQRLSSRKKRVGESIVDETLLEIGSELVWF
jgi:hypothetical protein